MLDYFALFMLLFVAVFLFYGIIALHDIPYEIAKKRQHPHQDANAEQIGPQTIESGQPSHSQEVEIGDIRPEHIPKINQ